MDSAILNVKHPVNLEATQVIACVTIPYSKIMIASFVKKAYLPGLGELYGGKLGLLAMKEFLNTGGVVNPRSAAASGTYWLGRMGRTLTCVPSLVSGIQGEWWFTSTSI